MLTRDKEINLILLADIHNADFLLDKIEPEFTQADSIVLSGDITHFGNAVQIERIINKISSFNTSILAVTGNCDYPEVGEYLTRKHHLLDTRGLSFRGFSWLGISGSLPCPGKTPNEFTEDQVEQLLGKVLRTVKPSYPLILVSHQPPVNTINDRLLNGAHVGSFAIRNYIEEAAPILCLTGHIHEAIGVDTIGSCTIVNPGPFRTGKYAVIRITGENSVNVDLKQVTV